MQQSKTYQAVCQVCSATQVVQANDVITLDGPCKIREWLPQKFTSIPSSKNYFAMEDDEKGWIVKCCSCWLHNK